MTYLRPTEKFVHDNRIVRPDALATHIAWIESMSGVAFAWFITATFEKAVDDLIDADISFGKWRQMVENDIFGRAKSTMKFWGVIEDSEIRYARLAHVHWHCLVTAVPKLFRTGPSRVERWSDPKVGFTELLQKVRLMTTCRGVLEQNSILNVKVEPVTAQEGAVDYLLKAIKRDQLVVLLDSDFAF